MFDEVFSKEKVNTGRQIEIDIAKAIAIFFMIVIHVYEEMSNANFDVFPTTIYENVLQFCAGPMAAPVFMLALGVGIIYSRHNTPKELLKRGILLFIFGYILNFCRDVVPTLIFATISGSAIEWEEILYYFLNVDIFMFAGLSYMFIAFLRYIKLSIIWYFPLMVAMQVLGQVLALYNPPTMIGKCFCGLFFYTERAGCFSFLQWFVFPIFGCLFGELLIRTKDKIKVYKFLFIVTLTSLASFLLGLTLEGADLRMIYSLKGDVYYYQGFYSRYFTLLFIGLEFSTIYLIRSKLQNDTIDKIATYLSKNLNNIYVIQWLIIGFTSSYFIYMKDDFLIDVKYVIPVGLAIEIVSIIIGDIYLKIKKAKGNRGESNVRV